MEAPQSFLAKKQSLICNGEIICLDKPLVMGIVNITTDSFFSGSQYNKKRKIKARVKEILEHGGSIVDIGACSTRPGSTPVSEKEEIARLSKSLSIIRKDFPNVIISVDTYRANVAKHVVDNFNVNMINDISAGNMDTAMIDTVASLSVPYIAMHMQGTPQTMQQNPVYENVTKDIISFFSKKVAHFHRAGIRDVIIDPGFGFGKTIAHNFELLQNLEAFKIFELPLLVGLSRKSTIYRTLKSTPEQALNGTTALNTIALLKGANILRVHDVKEAIEVVTLTSLTMKQPKGYN